MPASRLPPTNAAPTPPPAAPSNGSPSPAAPPPGTPLYRDRRWWAGLAFAFAIAAVAVGLALVPRIAATGFSALTLAIVLGIVLGNTVFPRIAADTGLGVDFARSRLLRAGIVLYGFRITFQQMLGIGWAGLVIDVVMVTATFGLAVLVGMRWMKLDRDTAMLVGAGSAICGAAAVLAAEPVLRAPAHKVSVAVATVVVFGTVAMFVYPLLYPVLGMDAHAFGLYTGSTVHEVAQVVAAGRAISQDVASTAVIEKMLRVMLLAPFLLGLSALVRRDAAAGTVRAPIVIPWFALGFVAVGAFNSLHWLPAAVVAVLVQLDTWLLAAAMAALGLRTHVGAIRQAGPRPLLLAGVLAVFLCVGGYGINVAVGHWLG